MWFFECLEVEPEYRRGWVLWRRSPLLLLRSVSCRSPYSVALTQLILLLLSLLCLSCSPYCLCLLFVSEIIFHDDTRFTEGEISSSSKNVASRGHFSRALLSKSNAGLSMI